MYTLHSYRPTDRFGTMVPGFPRITRDNDQGVSIYFGSIKRFIGSLISFRMKTFLSNHKPVYSCYRYVLKEIMEAYISSA